MVVVYQRQGGHFLWCTAERYPGCFGLTDKVRIYVGSLKRVGALAAAHVRIVLAWGHHPVPAEIIKVHYKRATATPRLVGILIAIVIYRSPHALFPIFLNSDFQDRNLSAYKQNSVKHKLKNPAKYTDPSIMHSLSVPSP